MATLKQSLTKGITAINVKTSTFMEESKCKTYISTLENEIKELKLSAGEKAYESWTNNGDIAGEIEEIFVKIKSKYQEIEVQKERMVQISQEEKQILGINSGSQPVENVAGAVYCSNCGAPNDSNYKFCSKCGTPLK